MALDERRGRVRALAADVAKIAGPVLGKRGFAAAQLITHWASIVGPDWAAKVAPERLAFPPGERRDGTLHLRVAPGLAPEVQHRAPLLLERLNGFFGYGAVARLRLLQGPMPRPEPKRSRPVLSGPRRAALDQRLEGVADPALRAALKAWGEAVLGTEEDD